MKQKVPANVARKLITAGSVKIVRFRFDAFGENADGRNTGWLQVPKVEAKRLLRDLYPGSEVYVDLADGAAYISGEHGGSSP
jgi:hypothetical protein